MRYVYIFSICVVGLLGGYVGFWMASRDRVREAAGPTIEHEVIKTDTRSAPGKVTVVTETKERIVKTQPKAPQASPPQYRAGIQIRPTQADLNGLWVTVGRRLAGSVWLEAAFDLKHHEATIGISYEF